MSMAEGFMDKLSAFARLVQEQQRQRMIRDYGQERIEIHQSACKTLVKVGNKFAKVDVGSSGKFMVDLATGEIYGIKAYGQVHRGHRFGTLDTTDDWDWGDYAPVQKRKEVMPTT